MKLTALVAGPALALLAASAPGASAAAVTTFDVDGAMFLFQTGIDIKGDVFGFWVDQSSVRHGYVRMKDGTLTKFDAPHAVDTSASGADASGNLVGDFVDGNLHKTRFYLRKIDGSFTVFDVAGNVHVTATDPHGGTVGYEPGHDSFLRKKTGKVKMFGAPNGSDTEAVAVISDGTVAGSFAPSQFPPVSSGFIRHPDKSFTVFDVAGADLTQVMGMNADGIVAGYYVVGQAHGFLRTPDGAIAPFDPSGSHLTQPTAISAKGLVAGYYKDADDVHHGFIRGVDGKFTIFDVAGAANTEPATINARGTVAGTWTDADGHTHGFVRTP
ncbi:MAG: hypothetical protein JOZ72_08655 [Alphaproteobacteria bacterium]|nr:hypothetical protein [Alphaproteobacteria bacterium]